MKNNMKYKWLLFDADGTLYDYDKAQFTALKDTFSQLGHNFDSHYAQLFSDINNQIWLEFESGTITQNRLKIERFEILFEQTNLSLDPSTVSKNYLENLANNYDLIEGAEQLIKQLASQVNLLLITNGPKDVQRSRIGKSTIGEYFEGVVISEEVGFSKPDTRIFDEAFKRMDHPQKSDVLIVGDSLSSDIKGGNNYEIDTCWFNPTQKTRAENLEISYEISHLQELLPILSTT